MTRLLASSLLICLFSAPALAQNNSRLFLVGAEPLNADMSFVEMTWLPPEAAVAPGLSGILEQDRRVPLAMEKCGKEHGIELLVAESDNTFGGFSLSLGFDSSFNDNFPVLLNCILLAIEAIEADDDIFLKNQQDFYDQVSFLDYVLSLMTEFAYGLAREEFADPVPRPSELFSLTFQDYRGAWPSLFAVSDLYVTAISPTGVADLLVAIDERIGKDFGSPDQAVLPEQPPYTAAPLEGLGLLLPAMNRSLFQVNRVFAPSLVGSLAEGRVFDFVINKRLNAFRVDQGLEPSNDIFIPLEEGQEEAATRVEGLSGLRPSFFADKKHIAAFTFFSIYEGPQPFAPTIDLQIDAIEAAMTLPFTEAEYASALNDLAKDYCAIEPTEGMAETQAMWLREDLFHGRAKDFIARNVMGCDTLTLERVNEVRDQALRNSATLVYGIGAIQRDAETLERPFCLVDNIGQLEFECSKSDYQL